MFTALDSRLSPGQDNCAVFLGKTPYSHSASFHPGGKMSTIELLGQPYKMLGGSQGE